jgi:Sulfotransferase domain
MRRSPPDFVIASAPKCGTTALFEYLSRHPQIFMPRKELKFFCSDLKTSGGVGSLDEYQRLFAAAPANCLTGDVSTLYLYSKVAIRRIMEQNPRTKVILVLRYPADAAHSLYAAGWSHRMENIASFEDAWRAQPARFAGERVPPHWPDPATLQYGPMYRYAEQVRRVFEWVPADQRYIVVFEEFFSAPHRHYPRLLEFLEVPSDGRAEFPVVNPAVGVRSALIEGFLRHSPAWFQAVYRPLRPLFRAAHIRPAHILWSWNSAARQKPALTAGFRAEVERYFAADIAELESMLGRPLWRQPELVQ